MSDYSRRYRTAKRLIEIMSLEELIGLLIDTKVLVSKGKLSDRYSQLLSTDKVCFLKDKNTK